MEASMKLKSQNTLYLAINVIPQGTIAAGTKITEPPLYGFPFVWDVLETKWSPNQWEEVELEVGDTIKIIGNSLGAPDKLDNLEAVIHKIEPHSSGARYGIVIDKNSSDFYMRMIWWYLADDLEFISHEGLSTASAKVPVAPKKPRRCLNPTE
jgi:hypothetical protein